MSNSTLTESAQASQSIFTILGGTTISDRAAIVRAECREGSRVELRTPADSGASAPRIEVWLECTSLLGMVKAWKRIGHVPDDVALALLDSPGPHPAVVGHGTVKTIYAPAGRDEAAVTVEIGPRRRA